MKIIDNSKIKYKTNIVKIVGKILEKVPRKFLNGLGEIYILDSAKGVQKKIKYIQSKNRESDSKIEIYMENSDFSGIPFFSILAINIYFIMVINEHIEKHIKPKTRDIEILSYATSRTNYSWMYFGLWTPLIFPIIILNYIISRVSLIKKAMFLWISNVLKKLDNTQ